MDRSKIRARRPVSIRAVLRNLHSRRLRGRQLPLSILLDQNRQEPHLGGEVKGAPSVFFPCAEMNPEAMALAPKTRAWISSTFTASHVASLLCGRDFDFLAADSVLEIYGQVVTGNQVL
jgi:hypothetical protein